MEKNEIFTVIQEAFVGLNEGGVLDEPVEVTGDTVLIGPDSVLDSIAFVTLFMDLEERLSEISGEETYLLIDEIHAFNPEDTFLTVNVLVDYIAQM